jgi:phospholipid transport system substrate-binding protein
MTKKVQSLLYFHRFALLVPIALAAVLLAARPGLAEGGTMPRDPAAFLTGFSGQAIEVLADRQMNDAQREVAFRRLFTAGFDIDMISRFVLGRYWRGASEPQRREYRQLFEDFIVATYARRLGGYSGEADFVVGPVRERSEKRAIVGSEIRPAEGPPIVVEWRLRRKGDDWRIVDIMIEGISMAITQRSEFYAVINNSGGGVEGLLQRLREKTQIASQKAS